MARSMYDVLHVNVLPGRKRYPVNTRSRHEELVLDVKVRTDKRVFGVRDAKRGGDVEETLLNCCFVVGSRVVAIIPPMAVSFHEVVCIWQGSPPNFGPEALRGPCFDFLDVALAKQCDVCELVVAMDYMMQEYTHFIHMIWNVVWPACVDSLVHGTIE